VRTRQPLELRQLRDFVILAEELNFRRAAERLFISQPSLSHQIALLEANLGIRLFRRDRRGVSLTTEGKAILEDARRLLAESEAIANKAHQLAEVDAATLRVGYPEFANRTVIPQILASFRQRHPGVRLQLSEGYSRKLVKDLRDAGLDLAFVMLPAAEDLSGFQVEPLIDEPPGVLLAANHRLAALPEIPAEAVAEEQLLLADRSVNPVMYDSVVAWVRQFGREPRFFPVGGSGVYTYDTAMRVIESGEAVSLTAESMAGFLSPGVVFRPIHGLAPHFQMAAVWSSQNRSDSLTAFLEAVRKMRARGDRQVQLTA
jgi:DNA-binding transcriptional LysR family regulator